MSVVLGRKQQSGKRNDLESAITTMRTGGPLAVAEQHSATVRDYHIQPGTSFNIHYPQFWGKLNQEERQLEYEGYCLMFPQFAI